MKRILYLELSSIMIILLFACSTSRITSSWTPAELTPRQFNKIMVLGLTGSAERDFRQKMEQHIVEDLQTRGYKAVSAFATYGPKEFEGSDEKTSLEKLKADGVEAVLTVVLLNKERERYYVPSRVRYSPYIIYQNRFWGYYRTIYDRVYTPGYYTSTTKYFWETNLYDLSDMSLIYSTQTESFDPESSERLGHEYGKLIINDLASKNVLKPAN